MNVTNSQRPSAYEKMSVISHRSFSGCGSCENTADQTILWNWGMFTYLMSCMQCTGHSFYQIEYFTWTVSQAQDQTWGPWSFEATTLPAAPWSIRCSSDVVWRIREWLDSSKNQVNSPLYTLRIWIICPTKMHHWLTFNISFYVNNIFCLCLME